MDRLASRMRYNSVFFCNGTFSFETRQSSRFHSYEVRAYITMGTEYTTLVVLRILLRTSTPFIAAVHDLSLSQRRYHWYISCTRHLLELSVARRCEPSLESGARRRLSLRLGVESEREKPRSRVTEFVKRETKRHNSKP